jgi:hypothetical protein
MLHDYIFGIYLIASPLKDAIAIYNNPTDLLAQNDKSPLAQATTVRN